MATRGICDAPRTALLDLCNVELEEAVEPLQQFLSTRHFVSEPLQGQSRWLSLEVAGKDAPGFAHYFAGQPMSTNELP